ncbi:MAG: hypothetical protein WC836_19020, partial [Desulfobacula sp.]
RSCQRYLAVTQTMAEPDPLRIRYRDILVRAVQTIVRGGLTPSVKNIRHQILDQIPEKDREAVIKILLDALLHLHEGSVARYRLKVSEFQSWKQAQGQSSR